MTSLKLLFRPSRVEGKEGILYIRVIHDRVARQVNLGCKLRSREWKDGRVDAETATDAPPMRWTGKASDLVEILYGMAEMGCINDGEIAVGELASFFYSLFNVDAKDCYRIYSDLKLRKNASRTYFLDKMQEKLNRRMEMDEEKDRARK